jgi:hypothetical protein
LETLKGSSGAACRIEDQHESEPRSVDLPVEDTEEEVSASDQEMSREIARFIAERAFEFDDHEARAWALTDFEAWATLAGKSAQLSLEAVSVSE